MKKLLTCAVSLCLSLAMVACGGGGDDQSTSPRLDGPVPTTSTYIAAQGYPGDLWKWTIDRSNSSNITFQATNTAVQPNLTYSGTAQQLPSGFLKFTIAQTNDPNVSVGDTRYGVEAPGTVMFVQSAGASGYAQVGLAEATTNPCPKDGDKYNWINLYGSGDPVFGISSVQGSGPYTVNHQFYLADGTAASTPTGSDTGFTCSAGKLSSSQSNATIQLSDTNMFLVDFGVNQGAIAGAQQGSVDQADFLKSGREFRGVYDAGFGNTQVWMRSSQGTTTIGAYSDFDNNVEDTTNTLTINFVNADPNQPGILRGTAHDTTGGSDYPFVIVVRKITAFGQTKFVGIGSMSIDTMAVAKNGSVGTQPQTASFLLMEK